MKKLFLGFALVGGLLAGCGDDKPGASCPTCVKLYDCCKAASPMSTAQCDSAYKPLLDACNMSTNAGAANMACQTGLTMLAAIPNAPAACK